MIAGGLVENDPKRTVDLFKHLPLRALEEIVVSACDLSFKAHEKSVKPSKRPPFGTKTTG